MIGHHTKVKGDLGVLKAQVDMCIKGWLILSPHTEHAPFDLVIWKDGIFKTIQVKFRKLEKNGTVNIKLASSWADKHGSHMKKMDKKYVDVICVYCPDTDKCYYFNPLNFENNVTLRIIRTNSNQKANINYADDYLEIP